MTTHARRTKPSCPAQHCPVENRADQPQVAANSAAFAVGQQSIGDCPELVFDLDHVDLGEIATALQDQGGLSDSWMSLVGDSRCQCPATRSVNGSVAVEAVADL